MHWPQYTMLGLYGFKFVSHLTSLSLAKPDETAAITSDAFAAVAGIGFSAWLLWAGGFWG